MEKTNWKRPLIAFLVMSVVGVATPLAIDMYYNYNDYLDLDPQSVSASMAIPMHPMHDAGRPDAQPDVQTKEAATPKDVQPEYNKDNKLRAKVRHRRPNMVKKAPKKWVCNEPRKLIQGSGTVRECHWE